MRSVATATAAGGISFIAWILVMGAIGSRSVAWAVLGGAASHAVMAPLVRRHLSVAGGRLQMVGGGEPGCGEPEVAEVSTTYRSALRTGLPANVGELLSLASFRVDLVVVGALLSREEVGIYAVALALAELLWLVPDGVTKVLLPHVAENHDRRDTGRLVGVTLVLAGAFASILFVVSEAVIPVVFGTAFAGARAPLAPLLAGALATGAWKMLSADLVARGWSGVRAASALTGLVVMIVADLVLVPRYGLVGAGAGSALGYLASAAHVSVVWRRLAETGRPSLHEAGSEPQVAPA